MDPKFIGDPGWIRTSDLQLRRMAGNLTISKEVASFSGVKLPKTLPFLQRLRDGPVGQIIIQRDRI
jgi:hypothetical protein